MWYIFILNTGTHSILYSWFLFSWMDAEALNTLTPKMIGDRPNTYTYTKSIAEVLLKEEYGSLPAAILRPSIVGATYQEPVRVSVFIVLW